MERLELAGIHTSLYNHPLCLLPEGLWPFARHSISDWKNVYLPQCQGCVRQGQCGGFFASATLKHSAHIHPFADNSKYRFLGPYTDRTTHMSGTGPRSEF